MAANTGFKQQCPSCDALVPIKDESLIGRKIDCPKCKHRFKVEDPDDEGDAGADDDKPAKKGKADESVTAKRPVNGKSVAKKGVGRRRDEDDEDEDDEEERGAPAKKSGGGKPNKMVLGLALAGVAVVLLGVAAFLAFSGGDSGKKTATGPNTTPPPPAPSAVVEKKEEPKVEAGPSLADISNMLPNETQVVINISVPELTKSTIGQAAFNTPGAFESSTLDRKLGVPMNDIERVIVAANKAQDWVFCVVRTVEGKTINLDRVKAALHLKPGDAPVQGQDYLVSDHNWLENSPFRPDTQEGNAPPGTRLMSVRLHDPQTLVFGDAVPVKQFLNVKGQFKTQSDAGAPVATAPKGGGPGMPTRPGGPTPPLGAMPTPPPGVTPPGGAGPNAKPGGAPSALVATSSPSYLTIGPALKTIMDQVETKTPVMISAVMDVDALMDLVKKSNPEVTKSPIAVVGASLNMKDGVGFMMSMECKTEDEAKNLRSQLRDGLNFFSIMAQSLQPPVKVEFVGEQPGMMGPGNMMRPPGVPGTMPAGKPGPGGIPRPGVPAAPGAPTLPGLPGQGNRQDNSGGSIRIELSQPVPPLEKNLQLNLLVKLNEAIMDQAYQELGRYSIRAKGEMDLATGGQRIHELAGASQRYAGQKQSFPRGTEDRLPDPKRGGRPWPPDERVSWMAELLPLMGDEYANVYSKINRQRSWKDKENYLASQTLIPAFLDVNSPLNSRYIDYPGVSWKVAATHFVGIAGVGLDAAEYDPKDPDQAKKMGVFGYDRITKIADILDGVSNTILMIQVPPSNKSPWLAGGGSTVRGVPETKSAQPFIFTQPDGKKGTLAIMADGSVRFIAETISDDVFKGLCTIKGGEKVQADQVAPVVAPPDNQAELKTSPDAPTAPAKDDKKPAPTKEEKKPDTKIEKKPDAKDEKKPEAKPEAKDEKKPEGAKP